MNNLETPNKIEKPNPEELLTRGKNLQQNYD